MMNWPEAFRDAVLCLSVALTLAAVAGCQAAAYFAAS